MTENVQNVESLHISNDLFKNVKCFVSGNLDPNIKKILLSCGATFTDYMVANPTHVICGKNYDETHIMEAADLYSVPSVTEEWVLACARIGRLAVIKPYSPTISTTSSPLFTKFVFSMSQLDVVDRKNLFGLISYNGGKVQKLFNNRTTHLICGAPVGPSYTKALELGRVKVTIVTPDWITESVKNKTLLNPETFHPRLIIPGSTPSGGNTTLSQPTQPQQRKLQVQVVKDEPSLSSIIGIDFETEIGKTEVPIAREPPMSVTVVQTQNTAPSVATVVTPQQVIETPQQQQQTQPQSVPSQTSMAPTVLIQNVPSQAQVTTQPSTQSTPQSQSQQSQPNVQTQQQPVIQMQLQSQPTVQNTLIQPSQQVQQTQSVPPQQNVYIQQTTVGGNIQQTTMTQQQFNQMMQQNKAQGQNMFVVKTQQALPQSDQMSQQGQIIQQQDGGANIQVQQQIVQSPLTEPPQYVGSTIIRPQGQQMHVQGQRPQLSHPHMASMQQTIHQRPPGPQPGQQQQVIQQQKQQILVNQPFNIQQTRIITSIPGGGQQIITSQPINPQQGGPMQQQQQQQQQVQQVMGQQQVNVNIQKQAMPGQPMQHRPQGTMIIQNTQQQLNTSPGQQQLPPGSWAAQSPIQTQQVIQQSGGPTQQQVINQPPGPPQFVRAARPRFHHQLIQLDPQTHAQLQKMDPQKRQEYLQQLQQKRMMIRPQQVYQQSTDPQVVPRQGTQHILIRGQIPPGLNQQQQMQWLQQQAGVPTRPVLVRQSSNAPGLSPINQQQAGVPPTPQQFQVDPNAPPPQQQQQLLIQRQQYQRLQMSRDGGPKTPVSPRGPGFPPDGTDQQLIIDPNALQANKTKTALANMLSNRLGNNGGVNTMQEVSPEPSAASTLRLMTAQHNQPGQGPPRTPQELLALQQQQRRTLGNITNAAPPPSVIPGPQGPVVVPQSPSQIKTGIFSPNRVAITRPQFYGHNPNLKLHPDLFLLGCNFFIVEYDELNPTEISDWKAIIQKHGGEIEATYGARVTHVLCKTQRHGVVMQAIRDSKRCVTAYWLSDVVSKKIFQPPWQALHLPTPHTFGTQKPATKHIISVTGFEGEERDRIKQMVIESGAKLTTYFARQNTVLVCKRIDPQNPKYKRAKEWNIPVVNTIWLSDILLGNLTSMSQYETSKYQQYSLTSPFRIDYTLVTHLMNAWKAPINVTQEHHERIKRAFADPPQPPAKRQRTVPHLEDIPVEIICTKPPEADQIPHVIFSCVDNIEGLTRAVTVLGGKVVTDPIEVTVMVSTQLRRTIKLIYSLILAKQIVSSNWLVESAKAGHFLPFDNFSYASMDLVVDKITCNIGKVLASPIRRTLFERKIFYVTPKVTPSYKDVCKWIELCGGKVEKDRQSNAKIQEINVKMPNTYIIISCETDLHLVSHFTRQSKHSYCSVCSTEFITQSIMTQTVNMEPYIIRT